MSLLYQIDKFFQACDIRSQKIGDTMLMPGMGFNLLRRTSSQSAFVPHMHHLPCLRYQSRRFLKSEVIRSVSVIVFSWVEQSVTYNLTIVSQHRKDK